MEKNTKDAQSVDYGRLTGLLIEATKEQQAPIHKQQEQIARLTRQVKTIQATLNANGRNGSAVHTVKAEAARVRQYPQGRNSVWKHCSDFGSRYSEYGACNPYANDSPVIVDSEGTFYG